MLKGKIVMERMWRSKRVVSVIFLLFLLSFTTSCSNTVKMESPEEGFVSLFNGKDLTGWQKHEGQNKGKWFVEDGAIVGIQYPPGKGGFLCTTKKFRDYELRLETKIDWPFDSGIFLRVASGKSIMSHQVTLDYRPTGEMCGIYMPTGKGFVSHCPEGVKLFKKDQWNKLRIIIQDEPAHIKVWLNDKLVTTFQHTKKTTAKVPAEGTIALQVHPGSKRGYETSQAMFRNIRIKQL